MRELIAALDECSNSLESFGLLKNAYMLDVYANTLEAAQDSPASVKKSQIRNMLEDIVANLESTLKDTERIDATIVQRSFTPEFKKAQKSLVDMRKDISHLRAKILQIANPKSPEMVQ